ncbi:hypothetical protein V2J09_010637 [Rumex salicifolius]
MTDQTLSVHAQTQNFQSPEFVPETPNSITPMATESPADTKPPDKPPDKAVTWKDIVAGKSGASRPVLSEEFLCGKITIQYPEGEEGDPIISIAPEVVAVLADVWKSAVIVKPLGKFIPYTVMESKLQSLWKPSNKMTILDLANGYYVVRFDSQHDHANVMTGGPWMVFGHYLVLKAWYPTFDPEKDLISSTPAWVRISNLPFFLYEEGVLRNIARGIGEVIRVDTRTLYSDRGRYARVCVMVDLTKPLKGKIRVKAGDLDGSYLLDYEGLELICHKCGRYGHLIDSCPTAPKAEVKAKSPSKPDAGDGKTQGQRTIPGYEGSSDGSSGSKELKTWMNASARKRAARAKRRAAERLQAAEDNGSGSRSQSGRTSGNQGKPTKNGADKGKQKQEEKVDKNLAGSQGNILQALPSTASLSFPAGPFQKPDKEKEAKTIKKVWRQRKKAADTALGEDNKDSRNGPVKRRRNESNQPNRESPSSSNSETEVLPTSSCEANGPCIAGPLNQPTQPGPHDDLDQSSKDGEAHEDVMVEASDHLEEGHDLSSDAIMELNQTDAQAPEQGTAKQLAPASDPDPGDQS